MDMIDKLSFLLDKKGKKLESKLLKITYTKEVVCNSVSQIGAKRHQICSEYIEIFGLMSAKFNK